MGSLEAGSLSSSLCCDSLTRISEKTQHDLELTAGVNCSNTIGCDDLSCGTINLIIFSFNFIQTYLLYELLICTVFLIDLLATCLYFSCENGGTCNSDENYACDCIEGSDGLFCEEGMLFDFEISMPFLIY